MEVIKLTKYKALDGSFFNDESECIKYDELVKKVNKIMEPIGSPVKDEGCSFANGEGYIQRNLGKVNRAKIELTKLGNEYFLQQSIDYINSDKWINYSGKTREQAIKDRKAENPYSFDFIGRVMDDSGNKILYSSWTRLICIDNKGREWGQPYYAFNPTKGKQIEFKN